MKTKREEFIKKCAQMMKTDPDCPTCKSPMLVRKGKFGDFYYCRNSTPTEKHGTISVRAWRAIMAHLTRQEPIGMPHHVPDLDFEIQRQMTAFGVLPTDLDLFVEGTVNDPWGDPVDYSDEPDHWTNFRPY